jgi:hypothetical protein
VIEFDAGEMMLLRSFRHSDPESLSMARPGRVLFDDARGLMTWTGAGWPHIRQQARDGSTPRTLTAQSGIDWEMVTATWWSGVLTLVPPGRAHSVWWFFDSAGRFQNWYVNLEEPQVRWRCEGRTIAGGVDTADNALDLVGARTAEGNLATWKDEDEFTERIGHAWYWDRKTAAAIRAEGERVADAIRAAVFPFDGAYCDFRPDPAWPAPDDLTAAWLPRAWSRGTVGP